MVRVVNSTKQTQDEITVSVRELLEDGAMLGQIMVVLRDTVFIPKRIAVIRDNSNLWQVRAFPTTNGVLTRQSKLFAHVSLAACVEFALKYEVPHD